MSGFELGVAVIEAAKFAVEVSELIKEYIETVRKFDDIVNDLHQQVDGLGRVLQSLCVVLESPDFQAMKMPGSESLRQHLPALISSCHTTLGKTKFVISELHTSGRLNAWKKNWRAIKLMSTRKEIDELLSLSKTHSMNLQIAVTTANLMVSVHSPRILISEQNAQFEKLERMLVVLAEGMQPKSKKTSVYVAAIDGETKKLTTTAMEIMSSASTVAGRSISGRTLIVDDEPAFEFIGEKSNFESQESTTGSEYGEPLDDGKSSEVEGWIDFSQSGSVNQDPRLNAVHEISPPDPTREDSAKSQSSVGSILANITGGWLSRSSTGLYADPDDEGDEYEIAEKIFRKASEQLEARNISSANKLFQEGFKFAENLSVKSQEKLDLTGLKLKYASSSGPENAELIYAGIIQETPSTSLQLEQVLAATHELARLKLEQSYLEDAEEYCRQALKGRRQARSIGKQHPDYHASLKLLVDILSLQHDYATARHYADLLPLDLKGDLDRRLAILQATRENKTSLGPPGPSLPPRTRSPLRYPTISQ